MSEVDPEDAKLLVLARSAGKRAGTAQGAAVRDDIGRTYAAAAVGLRSLTLTALQAAVAAAVSSGATRFEAVAVVGDGEPGESDQALLAEVGDPRLLLAGADGTLRA